MNNTNNNTNQVLNGKNNTTITPQATVTPLVNSPQPTATSVVNTNTNLNQTTSNSKPTDPTNSGISPINPKVVVAIDHNAEAKEVTVEAVNPMPNVNATETVVTPVINEVAPVTEVNTNKSKSGGNVLFFIIVIILLLSVFFIDDIVDLLTSDNYQYLNGITPDKTSNNLLDGFIKIGENDSFMKLEKIKFYDFKKTTTDTISFSYVSDKSVSKPESLEIYIEIYNSDKELIYKELFNPQSKIENSVVTQYNILVTDDIYSKAFYSKAVTYTKEELNSTKTMICTYKISNNNIDLVYSHTYNFTNNNLKSYYVSLSYTNDNTNAESEKYKAEIASEYASINELGISNEYKENLLKYSIDLTNYPENYQPLFELNTLPTAINNKETLKKWTCE